MKELYYQQLQELSGQAICHLLFGWGLSFLMMGPIVRSATHGWMLRLPPTLTIATFLSVQASNWQRPNRTFHELMSQPAPHGSYLRRTQKEHFPVFWHQTSQNLHENGINLPEMA
jgi:hypothetical protein